MKRPAPARKPVRRRSVRRRNPDEFTASRVYFLRLREREMRVSEQELLVHERMAGAADELRAAIDSFVRKFPEERWMTDEERTLVYNTMRVFRSLAIPSALLTVVETRRIPPRRPGAR